jgi:hypothetical protein
MVKAAKRGKKTSAGGQHDGSGSGSLSLEPAKFSFVGAPVGAGGGAKHGEPRIKSIPGGIRITHSEVIGPVDASKNGYMRVHQLIPGTMPYLGKLAKGFQHFSWKKIVAHYVPEVPTTDGGRVAIAPWYEPTDPRNMLMQNDNGLFGGIWSFVQNLPGVQSAANWVASSAGFAVEQLLRNTFRTVGLLEVAWSPVGVGSYDDAKVPGYFVVVASDTQHTDTPTRIGDLWITYTVDLLASSQIVAPSYVRFVSQSSQPSNPALLDTGLTQWQGNKALARARGGDQIQFTYTGKVTVRIFMKGSSLVANGTGHNLYLEDGSASVPVDQLASVYDVSNAAYLTPPAGVSESGPYISTSTAYYHEMTFDVIDGQFLALNLGASGTMSSLDIMVEQCPLTRNPTIS